MKHIGIQQIASLVPDSCRLDESFVFLGNDGIARLAGYNIVGCRLLLMVSDGTLDMKINGKHAVVRENDFVDILEGTRVCFAMPDPEIRVICMVTTRKFSTGTMAAKRSKVERMNDFPVPRMSRNCLGLTCRLMGQKRVPMPPAMITQ